MSVICPQCHTENQAGDKFCQECGSPLPAVSDPAQLDTGSGPGSNGGAPILVRLGSDGGQEFRIQGGATVGRLDSCDLAIHDSSVSRQHARISQANGGYRIQDLGSTNGTMINGTRISSPQMLHQGDIVTFGSVEFRYQVVTDPSLESGAPGDAAPAVATSTHEDHVDGSIFAASRPATPASVSPASEPDQKLEESGPPPVADPEPVSEEPAAIPPEPVPSPMPQAEASDDPVAVAHRLAQMVEDLAKRTETSEKEAAESRDRAQQLAGADEANAAVQRAIQRAPDMSMSEDQLASVERTLDSVVANPRDIEVLMGFSREASGIVGVVREYRQMRKVLQEVAQAVGTPPSQ